MSEFQLPVGFRLLPLSDGLNSLRFPVTGRAGVCGPRGVGYGPTCTVGEGAFQPNS